MPTREVLCSLSVYVVNLEKVGDILDRQHQCFLKLCIDSSAFYHTDAVMNLGWMKLYCNMTAK